MKKIVLLFLSITFGFYYLLSSEILNSIERINQIGSYLSSDELEGRFIGSDGNFKAGEFIIDHFKKIGLKPLNNSFKNEFLYSAGLSLDPISFVSFKYTVQKPGLPPEMWKVLERKWNAGTDWLPVGFSSDGEVTGQLVFAGYGVTAKEINYDDYEGIDVKGKIVIVLVDSAEHLPKQERFIPYSTRRYKALNAKEHGAAAIIFIKTQSDSANVFQPLSHDPNKNLDIIAIQANRTQIATFFPKNLNLYPVEMEMNQTKKPKSFEIPYTTITINVKTNIIEKNVFNVVGYVPGTDPEKKDEYLVVGAHFDHIGWGEYNSKYKGRQKMIHNGADDNASGVAGLIELAARIAENPLKRPVIFVSFNGEEIGQIGSENFIQTSPISSDKFIFMMNFDMIGRLKDNKINVFGYATADNFPEMIDSLALMDSIQVLRSADGYGPSDHATFFMKNIPVLFLFSGVHLDYHTPSDDWDKINVQGILKVVRFSEAILRNIGNAESKPIFRKVNEDKGASYQPTDRGYAKVWFGIIPAFEDNEYGLKVNGLTPGSPAEKFGIKAEDIITAINSDIIKNLGNFNSVLKKYSPGDEVDVSILRGGKKINIKLTLSSR
jgi:Zn-dependent M28 family amino/carboxypeptidase